MKRVLVITYYWPPAGGSGVQRWVKFAKYLPAEGWETVIYTPEILNGSPWTRPCLPTSLPRLKSSRGRSPNPTGCTAG